MEPYRVTFYDAILSFGKQEREKEGIFFFFSSEGQQQEKEKAAGDVCSRRRRIITDLPPRVS